MTRWGTAVLDRLPLAGDETVLDAGCGSGRVTERLADRLPRGRVVALDGSPAMIAEARRRLARFRARIDYVVADLGRPLPLDGPVDAILSTATFHWVPDHDALFRNLAAVVRPGGRLVAQCGGVGNIASIRAILATIGDGWLGPAHFESPAATRERLRGGRLHRGRDLAQPGTDAARARASRSRPTWPRSCSGRTSSASRRPSERPSSTASRAGSRPPRSTTFGSTSRLCGAVDPMPLRGYGGRAKPAPRRGRTRPWAPLPALNRQRRDSDPAGEHGPATAHGGGR